MILTPLSQHDPRLRQICAEVSTTLLREREQQAEIEAILNFVYGVTNKPLPGIQRDRTKPSTVGLSGNQVGIMKQICAMDLSIGRRGYTDMYVLVNPHVTWHSKALLEKAEGCVNFPEIWGITRRYRSVKVAALDRSGNEIELKLTGWPAILAQHEIDHLNGRLFIDRLIHPEQAHRVTEADYPLYHKTKPEKWDKFIDISSQIKPI